MKKNIALVLLCLVAVTVLWGCSQGQTEMTQREDSIGGDKSFPNQSDDDVETATYSVVQMFGSIPVFYQELPTGVEDVRNGRIAGFALDLSVLRVLASEQDNVDMEVIEIPASFFVGPMGAFAGFDNQVLIDEFNGFLAIAKSDGRIEKMKNRWFKGVPDLKELI
jgi:ABC-type amino acid transport substrate-binding protein